MRITQNKESKKEKKKKARKFRLKKEWKKTNVLHNIPFNLERKRMF